MKNTLKALAFVLIAVLAVSLIAGCKKKKEEVTGNDPYTIDLSLLPQVPWTSDECANVDKLGDGIFEGKDDACGICPTCEGKTTVVMNGEPFERPWADFAIYLPEFPEDINWMGFNRVRVRTRYYYDDFIEFDPANSKVMVSLIYDPEGDWRGPAEGPGPNTPLKAFNLTNGRRPGEEDFEEDEIPYGSRDGASGISSERGSFVFLEKAPSIILFQNADAEVAYAEVTEITFFFIPFD
jgi:hypothetical protein